MVSSSLALADRLHANSRRLVEPFSNRLSTLLADAVGKAALDDRLRHLPARKPGSWVLPIIAGHGPIGLGDLFGGMSAPLRGAVRFRTVRARGLRECGRDLRDHDLRDRGPPASRHFGWGLFSRCRRLKIFAFHALRAQK